MTNNLSPDEQLTYSTVRIECVRQDRRVRTGTGFCCSLLHKDGYFAPVIVTSKHVVTGAERGRLHVTLTNTTGQSRVVKSQTVTLDDFHARWLPHPETAVDLCVMPIAELLVEVQQRTNLMLPLLGSGLIPIPAELAALNAFEDVVVVGYPNGVWDSVNSRPVSRKGITATEPTVDYLGRPEFLIDMVWLPGLSGSPVFLWPSGSYATQGGEVNAGSRVKLLGILSSSLVRRVMDETELVAGAAPQQEGSLPAIPSLFSLVIKVRKLLEFEPILEALAVRGLQRWAW